MFLLLWHWSQRAPAGQPVLSSRAANRGGCSCPWSACRSSCSWPTASTGERSFPYFRRLEDANLELHLKQEELLDIKDDLFIKFLGIYDVNYAANSPRLFPDRLKDVADITARAMDADVCLIFLYDKKKDDLMLAATNGYRSEAVGKIRIPLGEGIEGWVGRRLEPVMLKDFHTDQRFRETSRTDAFRLHVGILFAALCVFERRPGRGHGGFIPQGEEFFR